MADDTTAHLGLPLPHPDHLLSQDVVRLRAALNGVDAAFYAHTAAINQSLAETTTAVDQALTDTTTAAHQALVDTTMTLNAAVAHQAEAQALAMQRARRRADLHRLLQLEIP